MSLTFTNPRDPENLALRGKIEEWMRESDLLTNDERLAAVVEESDRCGPNCPHTETVLKIETGAGTDRLATASAIVPDAVTRELRITKPLVFVRRADVRLLAAR